MPQNAEGEDITNCDIFEVPNWNLKLEVTICDLKITFKVAICDLKGRKERGYG
jgi:hypothetical protein